MPGTGAVRYAGYANDPHAPYAPVYFLDPNYVGFADLDENQQLTIMEMCGCDEDGNITLATPHAALWLKRDDDLALHRAGDNAGQYYGFVSPCYACTPDPSAPRGVRFADSWLPNVVAMRFPSTEFGLRKALKG